MILGLGTDIIEISRIEEVVNRYGLQFLSRIFTAAEREYCDKYRYPNQHRAGRFAAKEATAKALGTGIGKQISWTDIEVLNNKKGKPYVYLSPALRKHFSDPLIHLSISHCKQYATAVVLIQSRSVK